VLLVRLLERTRGARTDIRLPDRRHRLRLRLDDLSVGRLLRHGLLDCLLHRLRLCLHEHAALHHGGHAGHPHVGRLTDRLDGSLSVLLLHAHRLAVRPRALRCRAVQGGRRVGIHRRRVVVVIGAVAAASTGLARLVAEVVVRRDDLRAREPRREEERKNQADRVSQCTQEEGAAKRERPVSRSGAGQLMATTKGEGGKSGERSGDALLSALALCEA
jgi:hypothetical protein